MRGRQRRCLLPRAAQARLDRGLRRYGGAGEDCYSAAAAGVYSATATAGRLDHVGGCCRHGNGVPQDYAQAVSLIHIKAAVLDRLRAMSRPGESYSDVILRIAGREGAQ